MEGVWQFAYQNRFRFTGECDHPDATIQSCQTPGTQFLITNQKFNITYKACEGMTGTFDGSMIDTQKNLTLCAICQLSMLRNSLIFSNKITAPFLRDIIL